MVELPAGCCQMVVIMTTMRISRRTFARWLGSAIPMAAIAQPATKPNLVILFADDLGYGDLGCYGHPTIRTPNLDRMAAEGIRFTQFYSGAPVCSPSRAALLTGRLPIRTGVTKVLFPYSTGGLPKTEITLAEALKPLGYKTACVGKWHLGHLPQYLPMKRGFDSYLGIPYSNDMSPKENAGAKKYGAPPLPLLRGDKPVETEPDQRQLTPRYTAEAMRFIQESAESRQPFFLYLPYTFPHVPLYASERFRGKSARGLYGDVVEELDWSVGEVLRAIRDAGIEDNTLVMFTSDNGPWLIQKEEGGSAGLLREGKGSTWDGGMREPFIARWPGRIPAGVVSQEYGTTMDLFPTCLALAGGKLPGNRVYDGADLSGVLLRNETGRDFLHFFYADTELRAVRKGRWKLHLVTQDAGVRGPRVEHNPPLLYDMATDPSEKYDVGDSHPEVVKELLAAIDAHKRALKPGELQK